MTPNSDAKLELIRKLLAKAEAQGTTPEERDALAEKAGDLMIKYGIDEAVARAAATGEVKAEAIVRKTIFVADVPKSYSFEYAALAAHIAETLGAKGFITTDWDGRKGVVLVGFESDVALVEELYKSLTIQCTLNLASWFRQQSAFIVGGSARWNAKRAFIIGFSNGVADKLRRARKQAVADAGTRTELVLVDRSRALRDWIAAQMQTGKARSRGYDPFASGSGYRAGQQANTGQGTVGRSVPRRPAIGG